MHRLKNIEDNLNSNDDDGDNGNGKVGIFQIIKDIKDKGIKVSNDNEAISEIREHIQNLSNKGVKVNNFDEISKEIRDHIQNLKDEGIDVNINNDQVNDLVNKMLKGISKRDSGSESEDLDWEYLHPQNLESFFKKYKDKNIKTFYKSFGKRYNIDMYEINNDIKDYNDETISKYDFSQKYNTFIDNFNEFEKIQEKKNKGAIGIEKKIY